MARPKLPDISATKIIQPVLENMPLLKKISRKFELAEVRQHGVLEASLMELIKLRASQINGCGYCIDMHSKDARTLGESEQRLYGLSAWQEVLYYTERECGALALTEAGTLMADGHVPDEVYAQAQKKFIVENLV